MTTRDRRFQRIKSWQRGLWFARDGKRSSWRLMWRMRGWLSGRRWCRARIGHYKVTHL